MPALSPSAKKVPPHGRQSSPAAWLVKVQDEAGACTSTFYSPPPFHHTASLTPSPRSREEHLSSKELNRAERRVQCAADEQEGERQSKASSREGRRGRKYSPSLIQSLDRERTLIRDA